MRQRPAGHEVIKANLINDRGVHICKSMLAYKLFGENRDPIKEGIKPDHFVGEMYVLFNEKLKKDPALEEEAQKIAARHLPQPAYDYVLKCSHLFNLLDARGAISVTERTGYIARVRNLARLVAGEYLEQRKRLGYPLIKDEELRKTLIIDEEVL